jgi:hypothetical protein
MRLLQSLRRVVRYGLFLGLAVAPLAAFGLALTEGKPAGAGKPAPLQPAAARWMELAKADEPSFRRHVVPLMSRAGCSGRECHGAFSGQGGFQLSLFGYDFDKDHKAINAESDNGLRVDAAHPTDSLVLLKATNQEKHKGKERIKKGSWEYNLLLKWVQNGAKNDTVETGDFDRLEIEPREIVFGKAGEVKQLRVMAHWKDGTVEDVTQLTRFRTNDESVAVVSDTGKVECKEKGDTHIVAFYDNGVLPIPVMLPASEFTGAKFPKIPAKTKIDGLVLKKLSKAGIVPSELCTDAEFLRRVSLDMTATLPAPEEVRAFLADKAPDKRAKKVEQLLKTPGYAAWWTTLLCDFSGNNPRQLNTGGEIQLNDKFSRQWYDWIHQRVADNVPYDQIVAGLVLANGRTKPDQTYEDFAREMASYFREENRVDFAKRADMPYFWQRQNVRKPQEKALAFAHTFLGVRIECAECHKHPFDQWTQTDFKQFQAFFEPVNYGAKRSGSKQDGEGIDFNSVTDQIQASVGYDRKKQTNRNEYRKKLAELLKSGEVIPWQEVYVTPPKPTRPINEKEIARMKEKNPNFNGRVLTPKILGGDEVMLTTYPDPRGPLMEWLRSKENPYFARAMVNRVWAVYFGRGIVEPADDMNLANPPTNAELMDYLATGFAKSGYNLKWLHREIANSDTYQRSWKTTPSNKLDEKNFSHALIRRLPAEMVFDSIAMATASAAGQARFVADVDNRAIGPNASISGKTKAGDSYTLNTFGKPARLSNCDCERTSDPTLLQTIYTRNDPALLGLLDSAKRDGSGWIEEMRRATSPELTFEKLQAQMAKYEEGRTRLLEKKAEREKEGLEPEKIRQKYDGQIKEIDERIARTKTDLANAKDRKPIDFDRAIEDAFLRTVSRPPTTAEFAQAREDLAAANNPVDGLRELLWVMLNTREFMVNH